MGKKTESRLLWDSCYNVRDLGGFGTTSGVRVCSHRFVRADNLARLTERGKEELLSFGICVIVDLRSAHELAIDPPPFAATSKQDGFPQYVNLPLQNEDDKEAMAAMEEIDSPGELYVLMVDRFHHNIVLIMKFFAEATSFGTILFHCHSGRDRTGIIAVFLLDLAGLEAEEIAKDYAISNVYLCCRLDLW